MQDIPTRTTAALPHDDSGLPPALSLDKIDVLAPTIPVVNEHTPYHYASSLRTGNTCFDASHAVGYITRIKCQWVRHVGVTNINKRPLPSNGTD